MVGGATNWILYGWCDHTGEKAGARVDWVVRLAPEMAAKVALDSVRANGSSHGMQAQKALLVVKRQLLVSGCRCCGRNVVLTNVSCLFCNLAGEAHAAGMVKLLTWSRTCAHAIRYVLVCCCGVSIGSKSIVGTDNGSFISRCRVSTG